MIVKKVLTRRTRHTAHGSYQRLSTNATLPN
jgi:hypothetical protein